MAKIKESPKMDARDLILAKMNDEGRKLSWLAEKTGINYGTLYSCIVKKIYILTEKNLQLINEVLQTDFKL